MAQTVARKVIKFAFFILIIFCLGHALPGPEYYISYSFASKFCRFMYGDVNADSLYDAYSFIDWSIMLSIAITVYLITVKFINKIRGK
ncbi:hypothetical protein [Erwinia sp. JUb26]|uniref:hypothetical protein n=1 Tax=Erwinia sp. JUb26 TaxID=2485126 RepID=UPI000FB5A57C|nr:hypothetical protein [Erwinia sp. JUb26]ROR06235.1 hypothetical protein EC836_108157 [Erwinia sp. JUb26]